MNVNAMSSIAFGGDDSLTSSQAGAVLGGEEMSWLQSRAEGPRISVLAVKQV